MGIFISYEIWVPNHSRFNIISNYMYKYYLCAIDNIFAGIGKLFKWLLFAYNYVKPHNF